MTTPPSAGVGELLICDYCLAPWTAAGFLVGHALAPRPTRAVAALSTAYARGRRVAAGLGERARAGRLSGGRARER